MPPRASAVTEIDRLALARTSHKPEARGVLPDNPRCARTPAGIESPAPVGRIVQMGHMSPAPLSH